jgi:hypothetical protein
VALEMEGSHWICQFHTEGKSATFESEQPKHFLKIILKATANGKYIHNQLYKCDERA